MLRCLIVAAAASAASAAAPDCAAHPLLSPGACCNATAPATFDITFATTIGPFTVHVERKDAPIGADRLYNLAARHAFDSTGEGDNNAGFFRVVPNFVIQWGIPGNTSVSAAWESAVIANDPVVLSNVRGTLAYAAESDAQGQAYGRTTQLYINCACGGAQLAHICSAPHLPPFSLFPHLLLSWRQFSTGQNWLHANWDCV